MTTTTEKLATAVEVYCAELHRVRASGGATGERSSYGPLANLLSAVGATLKPKVFCVSELANQGAGHPDFGLYGARQVQKGRPREQQIPERGVVEVKGANDDAWLTATSDQVSRYWDRYRGTSKNDSPSKSPRGEGKVPSLRVTVKACHRKAGSCAITPIPCHIL